MSEWMANALNKVPSRPLLLALCITVLAGGGYFLGRLSGVDNRLAEHDLTQTKLTASISMLSELIKRQERDLDRLEDRVNAAR